MAISTDYMTLSESIESDFCFFILILSYKLLQQTVKSTKSFRDNNDSQNEKVPEALIITHK